MEPGQARTFTGRVKALKPETVAVAPKRIAIVNQLPPVLYINNAEGNVWAGKSVFVPAPEMAAVNKLVDEETTRQLQAAYPGVEVRRLTRAQAREAVDLDWIVELQPNGFIVPDFSWGDFAKIVLLGSVQVAGGTPAPMAIQNAAGDPAAAAGRADRPAYSMGTHAMYGSFVSVQIVWTIYEGKTWRKIAGEEANSSVKLRVGKLKKEWAQWTPEEQAIVWQDLQSQVPAILGAHLKDLGIGAAAKKN